MPASQDKIITKLRERRQIEADLQQMLAAGSELDLRRQAQKIASRGSQVLPTIVGNLDRADSEMLTAMGIVAALLDHDKVVEALRNATRQPQITDQGRIGAMTILERFLGQPPDDDLLSSLRDPEGVAVSSLEEVLAQAETSPAVLIEYVQGLDKQEPDVVLAVLGALREMSSGQSVRAIEPLRMMAQDVREEIAVEAIRVLGAIRRPEAARALQTLIPIVSPALRPQAQRLLRKLQFAGVHVGRLPVPAPEWRALVSAIDSLGRQQVWFIQGDGRTAHARFLNILVSDLAGAVEVVGHTQAPSSMLPPPRPEGYLHDVALPDGSGALLMLETSFDLGRRLVLEALERNRETQIPVAGPLRLLSPWLWAVAGADALPGRQLPDLPVVDESGTARLLAHPAFAAWTVRSEAILRAAEEALRHPGWDQEVWVRRLAKEMFGEPAVVRVFHQRLITMSEWLLLAGDKPNSRLALAAARTLLGQELQEHEFIQTLVLRDLQMARFSLAQMSEPAFTIEQNA
jgi:hypothetical protein